MVLPAKRANGRNRAYRVEFVGPNYVAREGGYGEEEGIYCIQSLKLQSQMLQRRPISPINGNAETLVYVFTLRSF